MLMFFQQGIRSAQIQVKAHCSPVTAMDIIDNVNDTVYIVTSGKDGLAMLWKANLRSYLCDPLAKMAEAESALQAVTSSPSGRRCAVGGWDQQLRLYASGKAVESDVTHTER